VSAKLFCFVLWSEALTWDQDWSGADLPPPSLARCVLDDLDAASSSLERANRHLLTDWQRMFSVYCERLFISAGYNKQKTLLASVFFSHATSSYSFSILPLLVLVLTDITKRTKMILCCTKCMQHKRFQLLLLETLQPIHSTWWLLHLKSVTGGFFIWSQWGSECTWWLLHLKSMSEWVYLVASSSEVSPVNLVSKSLHFMPDSRPLSHTDSHTQYNMKFVTLHNASAGLTWQVWHMPQAPRCKNNQIFFQAEDFIQ